MADIAHESRVLLGVDGSEQNRAAVAWALREASGRGSEVIAVNAWHLQALVYYAPGYLPIASDEMVDESLKLLQAAISGVPGHDEVKVEMRVEQGGARAVLTRLAGEPAVEMVVVGSRGHGGAASFLGSVSHALSHHCPKPLVVVPTGRPESGPPPMIRRIVVGVDGSATADAALRWAAEEATVHGALLEVVTAWPWSTVPSDVRGDTLDETLEAAAEKLLRQSVEKVAPGPGGINCTAREGYAPTVLLDMTDNADLLVVGSRGRGRAAEFILGSTSHQCVNRSRVPVVVVPTPEAGDGE